MPCCRSCWRPDPPRPEPNPRGSASPSAGAGSSRAPAGLASDLHRRSRGRASPVKERYWAGSCCCTLLPRSCSRAARWRTARIRRWLAGRRQWRQTQAELHFARYAVVADLYNARARHKVAAFAMIYRGVACPACVRHTAGAGGRAGVAARADRFGADLIAFRDREGRYLGCNKAFAEAYGIRARPWSGAATARCSRASPFAGAGRTP